MNLNYVGLVGAVVAVIVSFIALGQAAQGPQGPQGPAGKPGESFGAFPGGEIQVPVAFRDTVSLGGNVFATTSQGAVTYTAGAVSKFSLIQHTASAALTATLPASSTLTGFIPKAGDTQTVYLAPITTGITLAAGTGTDLNTASSTKFCVVNSVCELTFVRKANSDIEVFLRSSTGL